MTLSRNSASGPATRELFESLKQGHPVLGPADNWAREIDILVRNALQTDFPVCFAWGDEGIQIYNDAYIPIYGDKHPHAFGAPLRQSWSEIWEFLDPALQSVRANQKAVSFEGALLALDLGKGPEECYFDFSYSPVTSSTGTVLGVMSIANQKTQDVIFRRRKGLILPATESGSDPRRLSFQLRDVLLENTMDCAAAALYSADGQIGALGEATWTLRLQPETAVSLRPRVFAAAIEGGIRAIPHGMNDPSLATTGCVVPLYHLDGGSFGALLMVPNRLVPVQDSLFDYAHMLSSQFHAALHAAENEQEKLGNMSRALQERELLYGFMFNNIADGAFISEVGEEEIALAVNDSACRMLGYDRQELVGIKREDLFLAEDKVMADAVQKRSEQGTFLGDLLFRHKRGHQVRVEGSSTLVETPHGMRAVTLIRDITHREAAERERTERSRREAVTNLTGGLAHDFNNLLTVINGSLEVLIPTLDPDHPYLQAAKNALLATSRATGLTSQLLSYTRQQPLRPQVINLNNFLVQLKGLLRASLTEVSRLRLELAATALAVEVDETHLTTALINLATNARDSMPCGGEFRIESGLVSLDAESVGPDGHRVPPGQYARIVASDDGSGMTEDGIKRAFEPFYTTKETGKGTGLGLPMVQGFARQSGGDVRLTSAIGNGTSVEILIPIAKNQTYIPSAPQHETRSLSGLSVLCVEDNDLVRFQAQLLLNELGITTSLARDGVEALDMVGGGLQFDLLFTDLVMPGGMSGLDLIMSVRRSRPNLAALLTTGRDIAVASDQGLLHGFSFLAKPYARDELIVALTEALARAPSTQVSTS
jgi:PAS domain S-box-containing protein